SNFHAHASGLDAANAPGGRAKEEDVAGEALDREVFIEGTDNRFFRFGNDKVVRIFRNCTTRCDCGQPCSSSAADDIVDLIAMKEGSAAAALRRNAFGEHFNNGIEIRSWKIAVWVSAAGELEEVIQIPRFASC